MILYIDSTVSTEATGGPVLKMIFGWRDKPSLSPQECEDHYRNVHMKLARACFDGVDGFIAVAYSRVRSAAVNDYNQPEPREVDPDIDAFCELYFRDAESMQRAFDRPQMRLLFEDHPNFMNTQVRSNIRVYRMDETVFFGHRPGDPPPDAVAQTDDLYTET